MKHLAEKNIIKRVGEKSASFDLYTTNVEKKKLKKLQWNKKRQKEKNDLYFNN